MPRGSTVINICKNPPVYFCLLPFAPFLHHSPISLPLSSTGGSHGRAPPAAAPKLGMEVRGLASRAQRLEEELLERGVQARDGGLVPAGNAPPRLAPGVHLTITETLICPG